MHKGQATPDTGEYTRSFLESTFTPWFQQEYRDRVYWACRQVEGSRILDVGCGTQLVTALSLAKKGYYVVAIDSDEKIIGLAQDELSALPKNILKKIELLNTDLQALEVDLPFDTAILSHVLQESAEPKQLLTNLLTLLSPGGKIVITIPYGAKFGTDAQTRFDLPTLQSLIPDALSIETIDIIDLNIRATLRYDGKTKRYREDELLVIMSQGIIQSHLYTTRKADWLKKIIKNRDFSISQMNNRLKFANNKIIKFDLKKAKLEKKIAELEKDSKTLKELRSSIIIRVVWRIMRILRIIKA